LRASAFKSRTRVSEEPAEAPPAVVEVSGTLSATARAASTAPAQAVPAPAAPRPTLPASQQAASPPPILPAFQSPAQAPAAKGEARFVLRQQVATTGLRIPDLLRRWPQGFVPTPEQDGAAVPLAMAVLAVVTVAAATATIIAAGVAMYAVRRVKAVEQVSAPAPATPHNIPGLPGEAYSLSEQEAKIKSVGSGDQEPLHRYEELREPEAEWDTDSSDGGLDSSNK